MSKFYFLIFLVSPLSHPLYFLSSHYFGFASLFYLLTLQLIIFSRCSPPSFFTLTPPSLLFLCFLIISRLSPLIVLFMLHISQLLSCFFHFFLFSLSFNLFHHQSVLLYDLVFLLVVYVNSYRYSEVQGLISKQRTLILHFA